MRVLVAEDHPRLATTVATVLRREGMAADVAFDGQDALAHAAATGYDVIVLDRNLPRLHGDEVCRALLAGGCQTPILMLTAHLPASGDRDISQEPLTATRSRPLRSD
jgi:DNA-binding response OmpR family regulator